MAAWTETVEDGERSHEADQHDGPACDLHHEVEGAAKADHVEDDRQHQHQGDADQSRDDTADREGERDGRQLHEAAAFALAVYVVHRAQHGLRALVGTPQRRQNADAGANAETGGRALSQPLHLLFDDLHPAVGDEPGYAVEMGLNGRGVGEQSIDRHQRGDRWEQGQEREKRHARRLGHQLVLGKLVGCALGDVEPSARRNILGNGRVLTAVRGTLALSGVAARRCGQGLPLALRAQRFDPIGLAPTRGSIRKCEPRHRTERPEDG